MLVTFCENNRRNFVDEGGVKKGKEIISRCPEEHYKPLLLGHLYIFSMVPSKKQSIVFQKAVDRQGGNDMSPDCHLPVV